MSAIASQIIGVSIVCLTVCSGANQRKHQSSASLAFVRGIHRWPVNSPHKGPVTRKMFPFDDVIMLRKLSYSVEYYWLSSSHKCIKTFSCYRERIQCKINYETEYIGFNKYEVKRKRSLCRTCSFVIQQGMVTMRHCQETIKCGVCLAMFLLIYLANVTT